MKNKKILLGIIVILTVLIVGCGSANEVHSSTSSTRFELEYLGESEDVEEYRDSETGVHYLLYSETIYGYTSSGICPRYNADGSLYVD